MSRKCKYKLWLHELQHAPTAQVEWAQGAGIDPTNLAYKALWVAANRTDHITRGVLGSVVAPVKRRKQSINSQKHDGYRYHNACKRDHISSELCIPKFYRIDERVGIPTRDRAIE